MNAGHPDKLLSKLNKTCESLEQQFDQISAERKEKLAFLAEYITLKYQAKLIPELIVICTHNSRRSHMGQVWLSAAADYYNLPKLHSFSGGTESTAFNSSAVKALQDIGMSVDKSEEYHEDESNLIYDIKWRPEMTSYRAFSKKYNSAPNPQQNFGAIMVCSEASNDCPIVYGSDFRIPLTYDDPKAFDGTSLQEEKYKERALDIGREILYTMSLVKL